MMFLTSDQLQDLTGYKSAKKQVAWLSANGYRFDRRADGRPVVLLQQLLERQCRRSAKAPIQPDFSWMS